VLSDALSFVWLKVELKSAIPELAHREICYPVARTAVQQRDRYDAHGVVCKEPPR
jgi:hypothetical protein